MAASTSKLPRILATVGVGVALGLSGIWWFASAYSPFLVDTTFVLCPGSALGFLSEDMGWRIQLVTLIVEVAINGVLYYWLGWGIVALGERFRRSRGPGSGKGQLGA